MAEARGTAGRAATRRKPLEAADELFYAGGIRATGVEALAEKAGVTKVTPYSHFCGRLGVPLRRRCHAHKRPLRFRNGVGGGPTILGTLAGYLGLEAAFLATAALALLTMLARSSFGERPGAVEPSSGFASNDPRGDESR